MSAFVGDPVYPAVIGFKNPTAAAFSSGDVALSEFPGCACCGGGGGGCCPVCLEGDPPLFFVTFSGLTGCVCWDNVTYQLDPRYPTTGECIWSYNNGVTVACPGDATRTFGIGVRCFPGGFILGVSSFSNVAPFTRWDIISVYLLDPLTCDPDLDIDFTSFTYSTPFPVTCAPTAVNLTT